MTTTHAVEAHEGHGASAEVVDGRNRMGLYLFIVGDAVIVGSILFTYLYLRALHTSHDWRPTGVVPVSWVLNWGVVLFAALGAWVLWRGEEGLRERGRPITAVAGGAIVLALAGLVLQVIQMRGIPQPYSAAVSGGSGGTWVRGTYDSTMLVIGGLGVAHFAVLAFFGLALALRSRRGVVSSTNWHHVRLVRIYWVWVALSMLVTVLITSAAN